MQNNPSPLYPSRFQKRQNRDRPGCDLAFFKGLIWALIITGWGVAFLVWGLRPAGRAILSLFGV